VGDGAKRKALTSDMLLDSFGRVHNNLRISVTDRCNIRCFYCMPAENVRFKPRHELLTFEEIVRFVRVAAKLGIDKLRLTGGEPLLRHELPKLVEQLVAVPGIRDVALTTNGILLDEQAAALKAAGLHRLNISLDALSEDVFEQISRRKGLQRVIDGISAAQRVGFRKTRLNAVSIRGITESEIVPLAKFARQHDLELRFIEYMPLDAEQHWQHDQVLGGEEVRAIIDREVGELETLPVEDPSQPATDFQYTDGSGRVGFINPVTQPFCGSCNRLRLTAEGQVRNCLFSTVEWDARAILRDAQLNQITEESQLIDLITGCVGVKKLGHGIDTPSFIRPERAMYQIGG
jgi:GTP 3',8-cyclase